MNKWLKGTGLRKLCSESKREGWGCASRADSRSLKSYSIAWKNITGFLSVVWRYKQGPIKQNRTKPVGNLIVTAQTLTLSGSITAEVWVLRPELYNHKCPVHCHCVFSL
jgi:hypothetical protein